MSDSESPVGSIGEPRHTSPLSIGVGALLAAQNSILPAIAIIFSTGSFGLFAALPMVVGIVAVGTLFSWLRWKRLTYTVGAQDIRVESGVLSRSARSVPYERIQDVSLEQKLLPRLLGLVSVKFETGGGGGEDLALSYLTEEGGEELRRLVREMRDDEVQAVAEGEEAGPAAREEVVEPLFAMGPGRLLTFGIFEFSLAVFAVLAGLLQYADSFFNIEVWDPDVWQVFFEDQAGKVAGLGQSAQVVSAIAGIVGVFLIGSLTGMVRVFTREWGFLLERTARGFRRRRGMFTRTDVVMPIHRVQGLRIGTGWLRYRFGWQALRFVSLAQDAGASNHVVAPFAKREEIAPIVEAAGFRLPSHDEDWRRATLASLMVGAVFSALLMLVVAVGVWVLVTEVAPEWRTLATAVPLVIAAALFLGKLLSWRYRRHALDERQIMATSGVLAPRSQVATRLKLHSVEIEQGPIGRLLGYATLHLGQAGGVFAIPGVPVERARDVRRQVMETIAATDFSQLESQRAA